MSDKLRAAALVEPKQEPVAWLVTHEIGAVRYRGVYLDGVYTRQMALAIKNEVESILKFFEHTDNALKKSMKVED
ncbi:hypothetical protein UFOVP904_57, partial [uncultured Caudovirales phage]